MNLREFAALAVGDRIENHMAPGSTGEVVTVDATGVRVRWHGAGRIDNGVLPASPTWHYGVNSTAWTHWSMAEKEPAVGPELDAALDAFVAAKPASIMGSE